MARKTPLNWVEIVTHPKRFQTRPTCPEVWAGFEPLQVTVNWNDNRDEWLAVRVQAFSDPQGRALQTEPDHLEFFLSEGEVVKQLQFRGRVSEDGYCSFEVEFQRKEPPETLIVEPILRLRR